MEQILLMHPDIQYIKAFYFNMNMMSSTLILVITSIILLILLFPLFFFLRRRVDISLENEVLVLKSPFNTEKIDLDKALRSWKVQEAYYLRWGKFSAISMLFENGRRKNISSMYNQSNYDVLHRFLNTKFKSREIAG